MTSPLEVVQRLAILERAQAARERRQEGGRMNSEQEGKMIVLMERIASRLSLLVDAVESIDRRLEDIFHAMTPEEEERE